MHSIDQHRLCETFNEKSSLSTKEEKAENQMNINKKEHKLLRVLRYNKYKLNLAHFQQRQ